MFSFLQFVQRNWQIAKPPAQPTKSAEALRVGLLGASNIAYAVPSLIILIESNYTVM